MEKILDESNVLVWVPPRVAGNWRNYTWELFSL